MYGLSIANAFATATNFMSQTSTYVGRAFSDPSLLTISENNLQNPTLSRFAGTFNRITQTAQNSAFRFLLNKNSSGSYDSKPISRVIMAAIEEGAVVIGRYAPQMTRGGILSPTSIGLVCVVGASILLADENFRTMAMDQMSHAISLLQNDNTETAQSNQMEKQDIAAITQNTPLQASPHTIASHNRFMI